MHKLALALALVAALPLSAQTTPSEVTLGLSEYEALKKAQESPSATVIDSVVLSGSFRERGLSITFSGRTTGSRPLTRIIEQTNDVTIYGCKGEALITRSGKGAFDLIPLAGAFDVRCGLVISGSDRLRMNVTPAVLAVSSSVEDGELVAGEESESGVRAYTLVRQVAGPGETLAATATGRYLITLLPDATRFRYAIEVHNPNRTTSTLELQLQSNEHLQQIDSAAPYEVTEGRYVFSIAPGDSTIVLTGELRGTSFTAPVKASLQYLVLESHPLLRPTVRTPAKRISLSETGVTPQYRGAMGFETGSGRIDWTVARLEALRAISYAVNGADHTLFIPIDGPVLGESTFALRNEGASELALPAIPEPTYVSFDNEAMLMTKNAAGQLTVPLSPGEQAVLVQHRQPLRRGAGLAFGSLTVPKLDVPATNTGLRLTYPGQWIPLYESFASRARVWKPEVPDALQFLLLALWIERLLSWLGVAARRRMATAVLLALGATVVNTFFVLVLIAFGALTILFIASQARTVRRVVYGLVALGVVLIFLFGYIVTSSRKEAYQYESGSGGLASVDNARSRPDTQKIDMVVTDSAAPATPPESRPATDLAYQGLPAKFTLPNGERASYFSQELFRVDRPQTALVLAVSRSLVNWIGLLIGIVGALLLWRDRRSLAEAIRNRALRPAEVPVAT
jgi:hypothetical protein